MAWGPQRTCLIAATALALPPLACSPGCAIGGNWHLSLEQGQAPMPRTNPHRAGQAGHDYITMNELDTPRPRATCRVMAQRGRGRAGRGAGTPTPGGRSGCPPSRGRHVPAVPRGEVRPRAEYQMTLSLHPILSTMAATHARVPKVRPMGCGQFMEQDMGLCRVASGSGLCCLLQGLHFAPQAAGAEVRHIAQACLRQLLQHQVPRSLLLSGPTSELLAANLDACRAACRHAEGEQAHQERGVLLCTCTVHRALGASKPWRGAGGGSSSACTDSPQGVLSASVGHCAP